MVKDYILDIIHLHNEYTSTGMYMGLYFMSLLYIALFAGDPAGSRPVSGFSGSKPSSGKRRDLERIVYPSLIMLGFILLAGSTYFY